MACLAVSPVMAVQLLAQPSLSGARLPVPSPWSLHPLIGSSRPRRFVPSTSRVRVACSSPRAVLRETSAPQLGRPIYLVKVSQPLVIRAVIESIDQDRRCFSYRCHRPAEVLYIGCWTCLLLTVAATVADSWNRRQLSSKSKLRKSKILLVSNAR